MGSWKSAAQATLVFLLFAAPVQASDWLVFQSDRGFSVEYPAGWYRLGSDSDNTDSHGLDIVSSPNRVHAVIIGDGDEMIWVGERTDLPAEGYLEHWIKSVQRDPADAVIDVKKDVFVSDAKDQCSSVASLTSKIEIGPKTYQIQKDILCPIGTRLFWFSTVRWEVSPPRSDTPDILTRMVKSLRVSAQK